MVYLTPKNSSQKLQKKLQVHYACMHKNVAKRTVLDFEYVFFTMFCYSGDIHFYWHKTKISSCTRNQVLTNSVVVPTRAEASQAEIVKEL